LHLVRQLCDLGQDSGGKLRGQVELAIDAGQLGARFKGLAQALDHLAFGNPMALRPGFETNDHLVSRLDAPAGQGRGGIGYGDVVDETWIVR
jgi:hypothetical protein